MHHAMGWLKDPPKLEFKSFRQADGSLGTHLEGVSEVPVASTSDLAELVARGLGNPPRSACRDLASYNSTNATVINFIPFA